MKNIIIALLSIFITQNTIAQNSQTEYDTCSALSFRQGEWVHIQGQDTIRIYLRYHRSYDPNLNTVMDRLWGWHEYKRGNQIIQSNYQHRFMPLSFNIDDINIDNQSIWLRFDPEYFDMPLNERRYMGLITDSEYGNKEHEIKISFTVNYGIVVMVWKQYESEFYGNPRSNNNYTMTLPRTFTLVKQ